jgi:hypothetical protein
MCVFAGGVFAKFELNLIGSPPKKPVVILDNDFLNNVESKSSSRDLVDVNDVTIKDDILIESNDTGKTTKVPFVEKEQVSPSRTFSTVVDVQNIIKMDYVHKLNSGRYPTGDNLVAQYGAYGDSLNAHRFYNRIKKIVPNAVLVNPTSKNNASLTYIVVGLPGIDVDSEVSYINRQLGLDASVKKITYRQFKSNVTENKIVSNSITAKVPTAIVSDIKPIITNNLNIKSGDSKSLVENKTPLITAPENKEYQITEGRTLVSTVKEWLPDTDIQFADSSLWIKNIIFDSYVDCGDDKTVAVLKMQDMINNNPAMMKRKIHVMFKLTNNKLEISHES